MILTARGADKINQIYVALFLAKEIRRSRPHQAPPLLWQREQRLRHRCCMPRMILIRQREDRIMIVIGTRPAHRKPLPVLTIKITSVPREPSAARSKQTNNKNWAKQSTNDNKTRCAFADVSACTRLQGDMKRQCYWLRQNGGRWLHLKLP